METIYFDPTEMLNFRYFTYSDGQRVYINKRQVETMVRQGAAIVTLRA
jgi:hypothetical protein